MSGKSLKSLAWAIVAVTISVGSPRRAEAQEAKAAYGSMAPLEEYLMADRAAEIALARSAAPESISKDAEVMVLGKKGYESVGKGTNGFVCMVERSWTAGFDDPEFWNPKLRAPICFNPPGARYNVPLTLKKTGLALAGKSKGEIAAAIKVAFDKKEWPALEPGAMCYMLSKQGYLNDRDGRWHPHLMFFLPLTEPAAWGAGLAGSPVIGVKDKENGFTLFLIPVGKWSDGTAAEDH